MASEVLTISEMKIITSRAILISYSQTERDYETDQRVWPRQENISLTEP